MHIISANTLIQTNNNYATLNVHVVHGFYIEHEFLLVGFSLLIYQLLVSKIVFVHIEAQMHQHGSVIHMSRAIHTCDLLDM